MTASAAKGGLSIFDAEPDGGFATRLRGYDKIQVEQHIRNLESALEAQRTMNRELDKAIARLRSGTSSI
jgi:cell division septum initiation protein DivIVA